MFHPGPTRVRQRIVRAAGFLLLVACWSAGCAPETATEPTARPLNVRVVFPEGAGEPGFAAGRGAGVGAQPLSEMTARAIALVDDERIVEDAETIAIGPSDTRFRIPLSVRPAEFPALYLVEVEGSGVRETDGLQTEFGLLYIGEGLADLDEEVTQTPVDVLLVEVVPRVETDIQSDRVVLDWTSVPGAIGYRVRESVGGASEELETQDLSMTFFFDTSAEVRAYRVGALLPGGRIGAFSESSGTTGALGQLDLTVVDAQSGGPLAGATVTLRNDSAVTNEEGFVRFGDLEPGTLPLEVAAEGYILSTRNVEIVSGLTTTLRVTLTRELESGYRIVLTWDEHPHDLDSHLLTPPIERLAYHVYYGAPGSATSAPYAVLDLDDTDGFGPETTSIVQAFPGSYSFYVHNYTGQNGDEPFLAGSGAEVALYDENQLLTTVTVPEAGEGTWWSVLTLDAVSGEFEVINVLGNTDPSGLVGRAGEAGEAIGKPNR